jgi:hypothetical protein
MNPRTGRSVRATFDEAASGLEEVWAWLRFLPQFADLAEVIQTLAATGVPHVLVDRGPASRGPWCLEAAIDLEGRPFSSRSLAVRPRSEGPSLGFLWALCNSPLANAFVYTHAATGAVEVGAIRQMPVPRVTRTQAERVEEAVRAYFREIEGPSSVPLSPQRDAEEEKAKRLLLQLDAEVLRLYEMPPRLERQLLDFFAGQSRPGVPFRFDAYFPRDFEPCFPLHIYLSDEFRRSTADQLAARHRDVTSPTLLAALRNADEAFEPE